MTVNRIPGGLLDKSTGFFTVITESIPRTMCLLGGKPYSYIGTLECRKGIIRKDMKANPVKRCFYNYKNN